MVKILISLVCLFYASVCVAQTGLMIQASHKQIELGKNLTLTLTAPVPAPPLDTIDLSKLKTLFHINSDSEVERGEHRQTWKLRIFPYNKGQQTIPKLHLNDLKSKPIEVMVTDAIDPKSNLPLTIDYSISNSNPWVREQVLAIYTLKSSLKLYDINLNDPNSSSTVIQPLSTQETKIKHNNTKLFQYQTGFALFNLKSGQHTINLPPLVLKRDGTTTHRFYPPPFSLAVKPLPLYLPATVPVGDLTFRNSKPFQFNLTNRLAKTEFVLNSLQIQSSSLPDINNQLNSTESLQTYPPSIYETNLNNVDGLRNQIHYTLPFKATQQGIHSLKPIRLLNFDPVRGTLQAKEYPLPQFASLNIWASMLLILLISLVGIYILYTCYRYLFSRLKRYRYYRLALKQLAIAEDQQGIRTALNYISLAEGLSPNITPQKCLSHFVSDSIMKILGEPLNQFFYHVQKKSAPLEHPGKMDLPALINILKQAIKARHKLLF